LSISAFITRADALGRHRVVLADAEVDERPLGMVGQRLALRALDLLELVDVGALAVRRAADAVREQALEVGIAHDRESYDAGRRAMSGEATTRVGLTLRRAARIATVMTAAEYEAAGLYDPRAAMRPSGSCSSIG
jgi:hypothetical protein